MRKENVLIVGGNDARGHSLAWKLRASSSVRDLYFVGSNAATRNLGEVVPDDIGNSFFKLAQYCKLKGIGTTVVGPEAFLCRGIVDVFESEGLRIFGPTKAAAIEGSKIDQAQLIREARVPAPKSWAFHGFGDVCTFLESWHGPLVVKADGLAAGKGVEVFETPGESMQFIKSLMQGGAHNDAGRRLLIQERLVGKEFSVHVLCSGTNYIVLPTSRDHKRVFDGNLGPNGGGSGGYAPDDRITRDVMTEVELRIIVPTLKTLAMQGRPFKGLLYIGVMLTDSGPKVIGYNVRFGAPECQLYMRLLRSDLFDVINAVIDNDLAHLALEWFPGYAADIELCTEGYPGTLTNLNQPIEGLAQVSNCPDVRVFHAGSAFDGSHIVNSGGRVLSVTAVGTTLAEALVRANEAADLISWPGMHRRRDIGRDVLTSFAS